MPEPSASPLRRRALLFLGAVGVFGFGGGALANQAIARLLAVPDGAILPTYTDADVPEPGEGARDAGEGAMERLAGGEGAPSLAETPRRPQRPRVQSQKQYSDAIVRRNIFDSSAVYDPEAAKAAGVAGECKSDANLRLLATIVADQPVYSSALIATGAARDAKADGYAVGDSIGGEGRITLIEQKRVCMDDGSCLCMGEDAVKPVAAAAATGEGVTKEGDNKFIVDQSLLDDAMNNFETLATQVRVVPHKDGDGNIDGYRLSAIRRGSLFDKLGIKNGDIVHGVNGQALTSTEGALSTYQTLRNEKNFNFDLTRRNQRQTFEYEVR